MAESLKNIAYRHLRREMLKGRLPAGHRISPMASARSIGMSQTPVREAIGLLESDGLVEQVPGQGAFVCTPTARDFANLWDIRVMMESYAAARATRRIQPRQLAELERLFEKIRTNARKIRDIGEAAMKGPLLQEMAVDDASFHLVLLRAAQNSRVLKIVDNLQILSRLMTYAFPVPASIPRQMALEVRQHGLILQGVRRHNPKAARVAMRDHLRETRRVVLDTLKTRAADESDTTSPFILPEPVRRTIRKNERSLER